jgi:hypothetical protein
MKEFNLKILKKAIKELPKHTASELCWKNIEKEIANQRKLTDYKNAIKDLPTHKAPEEIWANLEKELGTNRKKQNHIKEFRFGLLKIAALLLLIIGFCFFLNKNKGYSNKAILQYSIETIGEAPNIDEETGVIKELNSLIQKQCNELPDKCKSEEYIQLNNMLKEIHLEEKKLKLLISENRDIQLDMYYSRLQDQQIEIQKRILQLMINHKI